jgi:hypothetical protein
MLESKIGFLESSMVVKIFGKEKKLRFDMVA